MSDLRDNGKKAGAVVDVQQPPGMPAWLLAEAEVRQAWIDAERTRAEVYADTETQRRKEWLAGEEEWERLWRDGVKDTHERTSLFEEHLMKIFRQTLNNAARTYKTITWMSVLMFLVGVGLFVYAVIYASVGSVKEYSALFAGMGATTFVAIWVLEPFDRAQSALANLMQAELCFTSTFEEIKLWKAFPGPPDPAADPEKLLKATEQIDQATRRAMSQLERYVEPKPRPRKWPFGSGDGAAKTADAPAVVQKAGKSTV